MLTVDVGLSGGGVGVWVMGGRAGGVGCFADDAAFVAPLFAEEESWAKAALLKAVPSNAATESVAIRCLTRLLFFRVVLPCCGSRVSARSALRVLLASGVDLTLMSLPGHYDNHLTLMIAGGRERYRQPDSAHKALVTDMRGPAMQPDVM
ncbi:hypothetical protein ABH926_008580 [Catenulispora sp. GP43]|uniref:hypothetical protein n=1 Tax=Catenulispora sp. GP43 TaxID=3156263 RepID=UPI003517561A